MRGDRVEIISVRSMKVRVSIEGSGPPLLMLNGIGCNIEMWEPLRSLLEGVQTIAFDAPGVGESDIFPKPARMKRLARLIVDLLDELGYEHVDLFGFSFGGMLAQQLAHDHPARIRRVVLAATTCGVGGVLGTPRAMKVLMTSRRYRDSEYLQRVAPIVYGGRSGSDPAFLADQHRARSARPPSRYGYASQLSATMGWSSARWLHRMRQPILVLAGEVDPVTPLANARIIAAGAPNAELRVVPGGGHLFPLDSAAEVAPMVLAWLEQD
jgi:poly(3-hydroxyalkanoate) depolymerase